MKNVSNVSNTITNTWTGFRFGRPVFGFGWIIGTISTVVALPNLMRRQHLKEAVS